MAINFNTSTPGILPSPWATALEDVLKGYKMAKEPGKMADEQKHRQLANQLSQMEAEHKPTEYALSDKQKQLANALQSEALKYLPKKQALEEKYKQSIIDKNNRPGGAGNLKPSGDVGNEFFIQQWEAQHGKDDPTAIALRKVQEAKQRALEVNTSSKEGYSSSLAFRSLPVDEKKRAVALTTGMGLDPTEGERLLASGKTLSEIAKDEGVKLDNIIPVYPVGGENIKQTQRRSAYVNELADLDSKTSEAQAEYQNRFLGYSLPQIADAITNENPDKQGRILAARALSPEISALRLKVAGGNIGIEAINELQNKSLNNLKILESTVSPEAYRAMQKYMNQWLGEAARKYEDTINDYGRLKGLGNSSSAESSSDQDLVYNPSTGRLE